MTELFSSGRVVDLILLLALLQGLLLAWLHRRSGKLIPPTDYFFCALPGACLLLALRAALVDAAWTVIASCLLAGLFSHWWDLWRRRPSRESTRSTS